jgi:HD-GYP domain-containing protein (c-di-GMP phosphodiesterase class II)
MAVARLVLAGLGPKLSGLTWETHHRLRIGRLNNLDVVLRDFTVERVHAEVKHQGASWVLRDLANSPNYPTLVNNTVLAGDDRVLRADDLLQLGKLQLKVVAIEDGSEARNRQPAPRLAGTLPVELPTPIVPAPPAAVVPPVAATLMTSGFHARIEASTKGSWDDALSRIALDPRAQPLQGKALLTLLRTNHHLSHISCLDELLQSILADAIATLGAQRASIVLADAATGQLHQKAVLAPGLRGPGPRRAYSRTLVQRCFAQGESLLCQDINADGELNMARSVRQGSMASVMCALLRTPRTRVGVLHLDRGLLQEPFTEADLYLADAIAASVAVAIESAQLVSQQRDQFIQTVTTLARAVEMRDQYTGDHTRRVTDYSLLLADALMLSSDEKYQIQIGTPLHDIGKIGIDDAILRKPGKLTAGEFEHMKSHTIKGASMLDSIFNLSPMIPIVRHHHERWDGSGYPDGLAREHIPLIARIVSVADAFDAMTSDRPYRPAMPVEQAYLELIHKAGTHFDPECVQAFLRLKTKVGEVAGRQ